MKIYININCKGHYPVGFAAVVVAGSSARAAVLLEKELADEGLEQIVKTADMKLIKPNKEYAEILVNGDY